MNTGWKDIEGMRTNGLSMGRAQLHIIFTSDELGETLSIGDNMMQFTAAYEDIEKLIRKVRKNNKKK